MQLLLLGELSSEGLVCGLSAWLLPYTRHFRQSNAGTVLTFVHCIALAGLATIETMAVFSPMTCFFHIKKSAQLLLLLLHMSNVRQIRFCHSRPLAVLFYQQPWLKDSESAFGRCLSYATCTVQGLQGVLDLMRFAVG
jgi:hypothetical protein